MIGINISCSTPYHLIIFVYISNLAFTVQYQVGSKHFIMKVQFLVLDTMHMLWSWKQIGGVALDAESRGQFNHVNNWWGGGGGINKFKPAFFHPRRTHIGYTNHFSYLCSHSQHVYFRIMFVCLHYCNQLINFPDIKMTLSYSHLLTYCCP